MQRIKQIPRPHKEEKISPDEIAQTLGASTEKAEQLIDCKTKALSTSALLGDDSDDDPFAWLSLDQHTLTPEQAFYRQVRTEELEQLFHPLSAKGRVILGHTYGVFGYKKLSADELDLRKMLSPDGVTKARNAALEHLRSRYPGSGLHLWREVSCAEGYMRQGFADIFVYQLNDAARQQSPYSLSPYTKSAKVTLADFCMRSILLFA